MVMFRMDRSTYIGSIKHSVSIRWDKCLSIMQSSIVAGGSSAPGPAPGPCLTMVGGRGRVEQLTAGVEVDTGYRGTLSTVGWAGPLTSGD